MANNAQWRGVVLGLGLCLYSPLRQPALAVRGGSESMPLAVVTVKVRLAVTASMLAVLLGLMAYTNPGPNKYEGFLNRLVLAELAKRPQPVNLAVLVFGGLPSRWLSVPPRRDDYVFLSVYDASLGDEHLRAVGLFNGFILMEQPSALVRP